MFVSKTKVLFASLCLLLATVSFVSAEIQTRSINTLKLTGEAADLVVSADGKRVFVLQTDGMLQVFSIQGQLEGTVEVGNDVTNITAQGESLLLLTRKGKPEVDYLLIDVIQKIATAGSPRLGKADAPVEIIVFDDFQCPYCAKISSVLKETVANSDGKASLVFKHFPLQMHQMAKPAAEASIAAQQQGKFWEYYDLVFANYNQLTDEKLVEFAKQLKLDMKKFEADRTNQKLIGKVDADMQEGVRVGVRGTPAIYINGRQYSGERSLQGLLRQVQVEMQQ